MYSSLRTFYESFHFGKAVVLTETETDSSFKAVSESSDMEMV